MRHSLNFFSLLSFIVLLSCAEGRLELPSVEDRVAASTKELLDALVDPSFGWRLEYKPTSNAGIFLILLDFDDDGTVRIQSDVSDEGGIYRDQTISYRIDQELETELTLETYAVFHYLFEQNQNSFGAEFEFIFEGEDGENLIFSSKSDPLSNATQLVFEPASATDPELLSNEIFSQLSGGSYRTGNLAGLNPTPIYQIYLEQENLSIFASFDLGIRRAKLLSAVVGKSYDEVANNPNSLKIDLTSDLSFSGDQIIFQSPISFTFDGSSYSFSSISTENFVQTDTSFCPDVQNISVSFDATVQTLGNTEMFSTLFSRHSPFIDEGREFYQINDFFIYDENQESIQPRVQEVFSNSIAFVLVYNGVPRGFEDGTFTGLGWVGIDQNNALEFFLRGMTVTDTTGNLLSFELNDETFITVSDSLDERNSLFSFTDEVFEGNTLFATEILSANSLLELYNPCNGYILFLAE
ncbi:MAG: DUF4302 domain-containing protein [Bacteroidota bacterium]